jgi:assimilatory nitrate reductase catalytic subunit
MTRTGASPRLARHLAEPFVEINPEDAARFEVANRGFARVSTQYGDCVLRVVVTDRQPGGHIFAPIHWTDETAAQARVGALVAPFFDPHSGQPEAKATPATIAPLAFEREGFVLSRKPLALPRTFWWVRVAIPGGIGYRVAGDLSNDDWLASFGSGFETGDIVEFRDAARGILRLATFADDRAEHVLAIAPHAAPWDAALALFARDGLNRAERLALLSGNAADGASADDPVICACFGVRAGRIQAAIGEGCRDAAAIGAKLEAGTNCSSCLPEIRRMIKG